MALTQRQRDERKTVRRRAERAKTVQSLASILKEFGDDHCVQTKQGMQRLVKEAIDKIFNHDDIRTTSLKKPSASDITKYCNVSPDVWSRLSSRVQKQIANQAHVLGCVKTSLVGRPSVSLKRPGIGDAWTESGGDFRTTILSAHIVLCSNGFFPPDVHHECSHLCHNPWCICLEHLVWEPKAVNNSRVKCVTVGRCLGGHDNYPDCLFCQPCSKP